VKTQFGPREDFRAIEFWIVADLLLSMPAGGLALVVRSLVIRAEAAL
jgi:hypothetical protein